MKNTSKLLRRDFYRSFIIRLESYCNYHTDANSSILLKNLSTKNYILKI